MREIKFRGKRIDNGEWLYGDYCKKGIYDVNNNYSVITHYIGFQIRDKFGIIYSKIGIDPNTLGQYTGLKDKNGKEIYEGDIIEEGGNMGIIEWDNEYAKYICKMKIGTSGLYLNQMKIIGNIYEHPELLEK